ncbi:MAG: transcriptional regulator, partial [Sporichthyaceae bacterium]|nr:transcriptional regulator [Sporichthyaceae bacterium]
ARLRVTATLAVLAPDDQITFPRLRELLDMTAGNLSTHLRKLEDAGYVQIVKSFSRRTPVTRIALTAPGRAAFERYTTSLQSMLTPPPIHDDPVRGPAISGAKP